MSYSPKVSYRRLASIRETPPSLDEDFVQTVWAEQLHLNPLKTLEGKKVSIIHSGFLNKQKGPDFTKACVILPDGEQYVGDIECHLKPIDWHRHGHDEDPAYNNVILHVVWERGAKDYFPSTQQHKCIHQIELSSQLALPLQTIRHLFTRSLPSARKEIFPQLPSSQLIPLLEDAGYCRIDQKRKIWNLRKKVFGFEQALWMGLAEVLGYQHNKELFRLIAQRLPIHRLLGIKPRIRREALLYGIAGFLPSTKLPPPIVLESDYIRSLWDCWWKDRSSSEYTAIPLHMWNLSGIRPINRPERRLAVLALLTHKKNWDKFLRLAKYPDLKELFGWHSSHPFWDTRYTLKSSKLKTPQKLIGNDRLQALFVNVLLPLSETSGDVLKNIQTAAPLNHIEKTTITRILCKPELLKTPLSLLARQGLLQIYHDFPE